MDLPRPGAVFGFVGKQLRSFGHDAAEDVYTDRIVRAIHHAGAAPVDESSHAFEFAVPSCRAHYGGNADCAEAFEIGHCDMRHRKLHRHVDAAEIFRRDSLLVHIRVDVQLEANGKASLRRELLDQTAHFPVSNNGKVLKHGALPPGSGASESFARRYRPRRAVRALKFFPPSCAPRGYCPVQTRTVRPMRARARECRW